MFSSYSELATEVYDLDKPVGHSFGDVEYYTQRLAGCKGRILEAAVGSGRMLIPLLQAGYLVDGMDCSPQMLSSCRRRLQERGLEAQLYEGLLQSFSLPSTYEAIVIPAGSFLLLEKHEDAKAALRCMYDHLEPGGRIILDLYLPTDLSMGTVSTKTWETPDQHVITMESKRVEVNFLHQYTVSYLKYEKWKNGHLVKTELQRFPLKWYGIEEFTLLLKSLRYSQISVSAGYQYGNPPSRTEQVFTFEACR
ncbi:class I SAM-dependent methyltransferase [Brevibacillus composti]|uniref:Class I SAM-dependent methyltransferase n=1 Tax=Brevibacillus composti TaxID=2796470 RepID=A0A7T5EJG4_9BACL|nr:class I SAM-dependent methyltransferase [Brevibacillus composti]QQE73762.1 class I SAM-dependent methyltransferase [Brevibacillus composti]QUO40845.1 class I SAM-dependent methyltransferase [Brevibacillus composti]